VIGWENKEVVFKKEGDKGWCEYSFFEKIQRQEKGRRKN